MRWAALLLLLWNFTELTSAVYFGKSLGKLSEYHHGVSGHVYAVDGRTLFIKDFTYDGEGPAAYFYVGNTKAPNNNGATRLRDERGSTGVLRRYRGKDITLTLPEGKTFHSIKWFSVWCDEFSVNFGDVKIPKNLDYPKPQKISPLAGVHAVSSDPIVIVDTQTLLIPNFSYDGEAPDAKFWVGRGDKPSPQGIKIPDENGKINPLRQYDHKTIVLTLPGDLTIFDIGHFGVWCEAFTVDFGHVKIPANLNVPPSLKMLGVSPQSKLNCEVLFDDFAFEVRWAVAGESVVIQLVAKLEDGEYMSFGLSGDDTHSQMVGSDVTVAWVDKSTLKGYAYDYYLDAKSQCAGTRGSCPDERIAEKTNSVRLLNAAMVNGYSIVTYQRPLKAADELDRAIKTDTPQPIVWAIGPLNSKKEVSYHTHFPKADRFLDFARPPAWNCPMPEMDEVDNRKPQPPTAANNGQYLLETSVEPAKNTYFSYDYTDTDTDTTGIKEQSVHKPASRPVPTPKPAPKVNAWEIPPINCDEPEDGVFYAQMGPTGGKQGYPAITGHVGWGISWYINGLLIPVINVVRGKTYTFVVEGGHDPDVPAKYHPFYITDDPVGGYEHKTPEERENINIYAGVRQTRTGDLIPIGVGRLCNWTPNLNGPDADDYSSFGAYQRSLTLKCDQGEPGVVTWTPDQNTPDTVYYQCFTHRYLGWKINVLDSCDISSQPSDIHETIIKRVEPSIEDTELSDDLYSRPSIRVSTRVKPDSNFLEQKNPNKLDEQSSNLKNLENHNFESKKEEGFPSEPNNNPEINMPFSKNQLKHVLDTVETYEKTNILNQTELGYSNERLPEILNHPNHPNHPINPKPMTLQTFMRPQGKPMMGNSMFYRRPIPPDMRFRRPGMQKPIIGMPPRLPPSMMMMQQPNYMTATKKQFVKMPSPMNRPPINTFGRPPVIMPMKQQPPPNTPKPVFNQPPIHKAPVILGKPNMLSQTLNLGQPTIIGQNNVGSHIVKSHLTIPSAGDNIPQPNIQTNYLNKPGQIIMGKPMDNPQPLDQQMLPTKYQPSHIQPVSPSPTRKTSPSKVEIVHAIRADLFYNNSKLGIVPSDFINSSVEVPTTEAPLRPAVNTGFKPDSVVIEGGFKPIIREPLLSGQDRITDYDVDSVTNNRRIDDETTPGDHVEGYNHILKDNYYEQFTQSFEPMFIPSPIDRHFQANLNTSDITNKIASFVEERPSPVYKPEEKSNSKVDKPNDDMKMSADKVDETYVSIESEQKDEEESKETEMEDEETVTEGDVSPGTVIAYDGQKLSEATLTTKLKNVNKYSAKLSTNSEQLTKTPQFGPFKGEKPSLTQSNPTPESIKNIKTVSNSHNFPGKTEDSYEVREPETTTKPPKSFASLFSEDDDDGKSIFDLFYDGSENDEEAISDKAEDRSDDYSEDRVKREAHHTPDHTGPGPEPEPAAEPEPHNHDHDHDHSHHDHEHNAFNSASHIHTSGIALTLLIITQIRYLFV